MIDYLTLADCNNPACDQKQGNIRANNQEDTDGKEKKGTNKQISEQEQRRKEKQQPHRQQKEKGRRQRHISTTAKDTPIKEARVHKTGRDAFLAVRSELQ